ncbi:MAG: metallophosphoesterase [Gammaproteobacteria bacterium]
MRIQIVSDLHLEFGPIALDVRDTDVLIAAGDVGLGSEGLEWLQRLPCPVIYVAGNHEYWGHDAPALSAALASLAEESNVRFLENNSVVVGDVRFLGCTLWTDYNSRDSAVMSEMLAMMNDFRHIRFGGRMGRPEDFAAQHDESRRWLSEELGSPFDGKTVVVTHHAPLAQSWYKGGEADIARFAYCNELSRLMAGHDIDLWVHGHVHEVQDYVSHGVRVVCNPRGYHDYCEVDEFDQTKVIAL